MKRSEPMRNLHAPTTRRQARRQPRPRLPGWRRRGTATWRKAIAASVCATKAERSPRLVPAIFSGACTPAPSVPTTTTQKPIPTSYWLGRGWIA